MKIITKKTIISPIHKSDNLLRIFNYYRPISLISDIAKKNCEKKKVVEFQEHYIILHDNHFGFRKSLGISALRTRKAFVSTPH